MKGLRNVGFALLAAALWFAPAARADDPAKQLGQAAAKKVDYLDRLVRFDQQQIKLGNLALERSQDPRVRELATRMVKDHESNLGTLRTWAQGRALEVAALSEDTSGQGTGGSGMQQQAIDSAKAARQEDVQKADAQSQKAEEAREKLSREEPGKFDKAFLSQAVDSEKKGVELLKQGQKTFSGDVTFAALLTKVQPVIEGHAAQAQSLKKLMD